MSTRIEKIETNKEFILERTLDKDTKVLEMKCENLYCINDIQWIYNIFENDNYFTWGYCNECIKYLWLMLAESGSHSYFREIYYHHNEVIDSYMEKSWKKKSIKKEDYFTGSSTTEWLSMSNDQIARFSEEYWNTIVERIDRVTEGVWIWTANPNQSMIVGTAREPWLSIDEDWRMTYNEWAVNG